MILNFSDKGTAPLTGVDGTICIFHSSYYFGYRGAFRTVLIYIADKDDTFLDITGQEECIVRTVVYQKAPL